MGRIGVLTVGGKSVETPCLTPVVHPLWRDLEIAEFERMGYKALMTNSLIVYRRCKEEAIEKGLHRLVGFDGVLMTDSGGYQVLEYGQLDVTPKIIAEFQSRIGSDLAVTLDRPTGYSNSRRYARETVKTSLEGALDTIRNFGDGKTTWVGPIQGGLFDDLVKRSARSLARAGFQMLALGSPVELMDNYRFDELVKMIVAARKSIPYSMPLHLFGAGHPLTLPLSVSLGCDTFDSASYILFAKQGRYMTERGTLTLEEMAYLPCSCPACNSTSRTELAQMERGERVKRIARHNLFLLRQEVLRCKEAISEGRLWDLVEERAAVHPRVSTAFRALVEQSEWLSHGTPLLKERGMLLRSELDRNRPELIKARRNLAELMTGIRRSRRPTAVVVAMREGEDRPLTRSVAFQRILKLAKSVPVDVYKIHPQLGPFPAELEFVYPFSQTIAAEKGYSKQNLDAAVERLRKLGYSKVRVYAGNPSKSMAVTERRTHAPKRNGGRS